MGYLERNLVPGETVLYKTRLHWMVMIWLLLEAALLAVAGLVLFVEGYEANPAGDARSAWLIAGLVCLAVAGILFATGVVRRRATEIAVSNRRVLIKKGVVSQSSLEILLPKIESVTVHESAFGRMLGYGDVTLRGTGGTFETFSRIARPDEFRRQVQQQTAPPESR